MAKDSEIDLWSMDEVKFQQYGSRCQMWIPPEVKDPVIFHAPTRKSVGYFGAVRLRDGRFVYSREEGKFNGESFLDFMKKLYRESKSRGRKAVIISDNARYHHAVLHKEWREKHERKFELDFLPPYSPDLNPIERVWKLTRRQSLHNRYFENLNEIIKSVEYRFDSWKKGNETLRKLCAIN